MKISYSQSQEFSNYLRVKFVHFSKSRPIFNIIVCKQTFQIFHISLVRISQKVEGLYCEILDVFISYEDKDIGRFSNLH